VNQRSLRWSSCGSCALWCHCTIRCVFVKVPSFSVCAAAGRKKTSVAISSLRISPVSISGPSFHHVALSISEKSRTTSQSSLDIPSRCMLVLAEPTAGFWPNRKYPLTDPSICAITVS
jgi:hypothetical protein